MGPVRLCAGRSGKPGQLPAVTPQLQIISCLMNHGYAQCVTYQPAARHWPFQFIEAGIFVAFAALLVAVTLAVINRRDA